MTNPVYITIASITTDVGAIACASDFVTDATVRKSMDITKVMVKDTKRKKKKASGSLRRLVKKYNGTLKVMALRIL